VYAGILGLTPPQHGWSHGAPNTSRLWSALRAVCTCGYVLARSRGVGRRAVRPHRVLRRAGGALDASDCGQGAERHDRSVCHVYGLGMADPVDELGNLGRLRDDPAKRMATVCVVALDGIRSRNGVDAALGAAPEEPRRHASLWCDHGASQVFVDDPCYITLDEARERDQLDALVARAGRLSVPLE
jgi:hypothetical protein